MSSLTKKRFFVREMRKRNRYTYGLYMVQYHPDPTQLKTDLKQYNYYHLFDLIGTLIQSVDASIELRRDPTAWEFCHSELPERLHQIYLQQWKPAHEHMVIYTNQGGIGKGWVSAFHVIQMIKKVAEHLGFPCTFLISPGLGKDPFRKPGIGLFAEPDTTGYLNPEKIRQWVSADYQSDLVLTQHLGIPFVAVHYYWKMSLQQLEWIRQLQQSPIGLFYGHYRLRFPSELAHQRGDQPLAVMIMGLPKSGKSTVADALEKRFGYTVVGESRHVSLDNVLQQESNPSVEPTVRRLVVDEPLVSKEQRLSWIEALHAYAFKVYLVELRWPRWLAYVLNQSSAYPVSFETIDQYFHQYHIPDMSEGYARIVSLNPLCV